MDGILPLQQLLLYCPSRSLISSLGMAIGVGGGSVLSRALGAKIMKNKSTFANQIMMTFIVFCFAFWESFSAEMLFLLFCKGAIIQPATEFFKPIILSVPF
jgi:Na+-driven multidrug efflux pump